VAWLGTDRAGTVWAANAAGIGRLTESGTVEVQCPVAGVVAAAFGPQGEVQSLTAEGKLVVCDGAGVRERADVLGWAGVAGRALAIDSTGGAWVATAAGLAQIAPDDARTLFTKDNGLLSSDVRGVAVDGEDTVWVATASGLARHLVDGRWTRYTTESTGGGLRDMDMRDVSVGAGGELWMATRAGLSRREPAEARWSYVDLPGAQRVVHDGADNLWISTGAGLYRVPVSVFTAVESP
jgi:ligand-binding sensor domain-containing protein